MKLKKEQNLKISLVIPVKNEEESVESLYASICEQSRLPDEVIFVDGGSNDKTVEIVRGLDNGKLKLNLIETERASPGKGRNIGVENASYEWIAFTDAGIRLEKDWLENLIKEAKKSPEINIIYGNCFPVTDTFFEKCATLSYVPPLRKSSIRGKFIASSLMKKEIWESVGGFPDLRAAEDLIFMESAEKKGFKSGYASDAKVWWQLRPDLTSTFRKFVLYSKHNVWAGRQWDWHYGIAKQYLFVLPFILLMLLHSWWWLIMVLAWLMARTVKRILPHRYEFGLTPLFNPAYFFFVMFLVLVIDIATFIGWGKAILSSKS